MLFNAPKTQFLHLSSQQNFPDNYPLYFNDAHLSPSSTLNILGQSFTETLNWKTHISSLAKSASKKLDVLCRFHQFSPPTSCWHCKGALSAPCMAYTSHVWGVSTHTELLNKVESKVFLLIDSPPLTDCLQHLTIHRIVASLAIFYRYFHANCMPSPLPRPHLTRFSTDSHPYSVHPPSARINQYLHSFFPFTSKFWNSLL